MEYRGEAQGGSDPRRACSLFSATGPRAQPGRSISTIGIINIAPAVSEQGLIDGLQKLGYAVGRDLHIEMFHADGDERRLSELVVRLIKAQCQIAVTASSAAVLALQAASSAMPIVMSGIADPVGSGLVESLSRPARNTTGVSLFATELVPKRLELLRELLPTLQRVALLAYKLHPATGLFLSQAERSASAMGFDVVPLAIEPTELERTFATLVLEKPDALLIQQSTAFNTIRARIAELALAARIPSMQEGRTFVANGGLMAYGVDPLALGRRAAEYVHKILGGARAADLPIEQGSKFNLVINARTARSLELIIPESLFLQADEVIE